MALRISNADMSDLSLPRNPGQQDGAEGPVILNDSGLTQIRQQAGQISVQGSAMPGMVLADIHWQTTEGVLIRDEMPSPDININFQLSGHMHTHFIGLGRKLDMAPGRHNLIYVPEKGDSHRIGPNAALEMLHISIEREHFKSLIGTEGEWCGQVLRNLESGRPFCGMEGTGIITPAMQRLIGELRRPTAPKPLQHLLMQSRTMELLALQLEQFIMATTSAKPPTDLRPEDADKLYALKCHIEAHFMEELSLAGLARVALLNEFKIKKGFRQLFGTTVFGYVKELRMRHADHLLREHSLRVEEVADRLGYEHAHHFTAAFKKHFGRTPSERKALLRP